MYSSAAIKKDGKFVCFEPFSITSPPPRLLACGHSFCSACTDSLLAGSTYMVFCPVCRSRLNSRVVPPINYQLLELKSDAVRSPPARIRGNKLRTFATTDLIVKTSAIPQRLHM
ncbi:hypothetical protein RB195_012468 [Necator americanus]|uniref:RING-type domain-containing protein n=1 Tax=Necator americanus TaxID=51031 RepID=A0ABR1D779_NECAM